jgi:hypothetical protein
LEQKAGFASILGRGPKYGGQVLRCTLVLRSVDWAHGFDGERKKRWVLELSAYYYYPGFFEREADLWKT